jgi:serine/threonine protein kinase/outer membrane protein assembly factor BamB
MGVEPGRVIGRFQICEEVGRGATGVVYRARDTLLNRQVAIKLLLTGVEPEARDHERFLSEGKALARLKHAQLALIYDYGRLPEGPFLAMEWIAGESLRQLLEREGRLPPARVVGLVSQLAAGLDYAHSQGILHCDIKPANLIVNEADQLTIVDFGLTWLTGSATLANSTGAGECYGTLLYASPEQLQGRSLTPASDLYSVACVAFELLTGSPPYTGSTAPALLGQHLQAPIPVISESNPYLPASLDPVFARALAKRPEARPASLTEFGRQLAAALAPGAPPKRHWRGKLIFSLLGLLAVTLLAQARGTQVNSPPPTPTPVVKPCIPGDAAWLNRGGDQAHSASVVELSPPADTQWQVKLGLKSWDVVAGLETIVLCYEDGHLEARNWINGSPRWQTKTTGVLDGPATLAIWNEPALVLTASKGAIQARQLTTGQPVWRRALGNDEPIAGGLTVADDGEIYALSSDGTLFQVHAESGEVGWSAHLSGLGEFTLAPVIDAAGIYLASAQGWVVAFDRSTHQEAWRSRVQGRPTALAVSGQLFVGCGAGQVHALSLLGHSHLWSRKLDGPVTGLVAAGGHLIANSEDQLAAWAGRTGEPQWLLTPPGGIVGQPVSDGSLVAISNYWGVFRLIDCNSGQIRSQINMPAPLRLAPVPLGKWWLTLSDTALTAFAPL